MLSPATPASSPRRSMSSGPEWNCYFIAKLKQTDGIFLNFFFICPTLQPLAKQPQLEQCSSFVILVPRSEDCDAINSRRAERSCWRRVDEEPERLQQTSADTFSCGTSFWASTGLQTISLMGVEPKLSPALVQYTENVQVHFHTALGGPSDGDASFLSIVFRLNSIKFKLGFLTFVLLALV